MSQRIELLVLPETAFDNIALGALINEKVGEKVADWVVRKRSIDARSKQTKYLLQIEINPVARPQDFGIQLAPLPSNAPQTVVVGFGPAGIFAAMALIRRGIKPIIIERGKRVRERRRDLAQLNKSGIVNPNSNYCFGEGGAGTYSDGKLYTRSGKRGSIEEVLHTFVAYGASPTILVDARPHIGTNKLPGIIESMREALLAAGAELYFDAQLTDIIIQHNTLKAISINHGAKEIACDALILATGHSARDIYELLQKKGIQIESKPFALGVRIEHPQSLIDSLQYHCDLRGPYLPPAYYSHVTQANDRGVFSFCMCPGGIIAPAATAASEVVVNGWSPSKRNGKFANSGMVVSVDTKDWNSFKDEGELAAMAFQKSIEQKAYLLGGGQLRAPAQRMMDFLKNKTSQDLPECSYHPGITSVPLQEMLPPSVNKALQVGLETFSKKMKGYGTNEAVLVATESRTSSPVRIPRDSETLMHPQIKGLYPCGEGAGYAGGIVSAAIDGIKVAEHIRL